jgi:hypothetical protein
MKIITVNFLVAERQLQSSLTGEDSNGAAAAIENMYIAIKFFFLDPVGLFPSSFTKTRHELSCCSSQIMY